MRGLVIGLLGGITVWNGDTEVSAGTPKQACVLACLAFAPRQAVPADVLIERVWGSEPPEAARGSLAAYVARLRRLLRDGGVTIDNRSGSYVLEIDPSRVDLHAMRSLVAEARKSAGDPPAAAAKWRAALGLWRGRPLSGIDSRWAEAAGVGLEHERLGALTGLFDAELASGRHAEVLGELAAAVDQYPCNDTLNSQHLLALYRNGQTVGALEAFRRARSRYRELQGIEPTARLAELHRRILADDAGLREPAADATPPRSAVPRQLPAPLSALYGRDAALARAEAAVTSGGRCVAFVGAGGVGKTAAALAWANKIAPSFVDGQLFADLRGFSEAEPVAPSVVLAGFLRALGIAASDLPSRQEELAALYRTTVAERHVLVVLDNAAGAAQARPLLPGAGNCLTVITSRDDLRGLRVDQDVTVIPVDELSMDDSVRVLGAHRDAGRPGRQADLARLAELCGRLPLALKLAAGQLTTGTDAELADLLRDLESGDRLGTLSDGTSRQGGLDATIGASYATLPRRDRFVFRLCGAHPSGGMDAAALANMGGAAVSEVNRALRRLEAVHLARRAADQWFMHDLVRDYAARRAAADADIAKRLPLLYDWYTAALHRAKDRVYGRSPWDAPECTAPLPELDTIDAAIAWTDARIAMQVLLIRQAADEHPHRAQHLMRLARPALRGSGLLRDWGRTLEAIRDSFAANRDTASWCRAMVHLAIFYGDIGERSRAAALGRQAIDEARRIGDLVSVSEAAGVVAQGLCDSGDNREALRYFDIAIEGYSAEPDPVAAASAMYERGRVLYRLEEADAARRLLERVHGVWREHGATNPLAYVLADQGRLAARGGDLEAADSLLRQAIDIADASGARSGEGYARAVSAIVLHRLGRGAASTEQHTAAMRLFPDIPNLTVRIEMLNFAGALRAARGEPAEAVQFHLEAAALAESAEETYERGRAHHLLSDAYSRLGRGDEAARHGAEAAAIFALCRTPAPSDAILSTRAAKGTAKSPVTTGYKSPDFGAVARGSFLSDAIDTLSDGRFVGLVTDPDVHRKPSFRRRTPHGQWRARGAGTAPGT
ncbi:MAG TPA: BTAD domain-containing putative transcriptional regulator, partial [Stackebrandtia sp.]|uniref:AfsR/SARP family transcriptional regulator n=1 Tax=Stackebrandtia sp. TaxID=2023065 RepID=UPI002D42ABD4